MTHQKPLNATTADDLRRVYESMPSIKNLMSFEAAQADQTIALLMRHQAATGLLGEPQPEAAPLRKLPAPVWGRAYLFEDDVKAIYSALRQAFHLINGETLAGGQDVTRQLEGAMQKLADKTKPKNNGNKHKRVH